MTPIQYLMGATFGISLACGQLLFKVTANQTTVDGEPLPLLRVLFSWSMISACVLYGLTVILYVYMLRDMPLSRAYLFTMIASVLVPFLAIAVFGETLSIRYLVGAALVFIGVAISSSG